MTRVRSRLAGYDTAGIDVTDGQWTRDKTATPHL